ncbi:DUF5133 domain-containing protein [Streptomyces sp. NPDC054804]
MLMPHPATLRKLVEEYETVLATETVGDDDVLCTRLQDVAYTLCVSTGTREIAHALQVAHDYLDRTIDSAEIMPGLGRSRAIVASGGVARGRSRSALPTA